MFYSEEFWNYALIYAQQSVKCSNNEDMQIGYKQNELLIFVAIDVDQKSKRV